MTPRFTSSSLLRLLFPVDVVVADDNDPAVEEYECENVDEADDDDDETGAKGVCVWYFDFNRARRSAAEGRRLRCCGQWSQVSAQFGFFGFNRCRADAIASPALLEMTCVG
jgi:hypothetical protein